MSTQDADPSAEQRLFLELIYEHFDKTLEWPEAALIKRELYQREYRRVVIDDTDLARGVRRRGAGGGGADHGQGPIGAGSTKAGFQRGHFPQKRVLRMGKFV